MESKQIEGNKIYFKGANNKYYKLVKACQLYNNRTNVFIYFDCKAKECELKEVEQRRVPADDHSKKLKTVTFYDLIPTGRTKKYDYVLYSNQLIENWIVKDQE